MTRIHVFADESGNFDFSRSRGASRYFILTAVTFFDDRATCDDLQQLRYDLAWNNVDHPGAFHATEDHQVVRDQVFAALAPHRFRIDAIVLEKSKAQARLRATDETFYQYAWWFLMKHAAPRIVRSADELLVVSASIGTNAKRQAFHSAVRRVMNQVTPGVAMNTAAWQASSDTGLQVADYCCWALKRKWEDSDTRSYELIRDKIASEFDVFAWGATHHY